MLPTNTLQGLAAPPVVLRGYLVPRLRFSAMGLIDLGVLEPVRDRAREGGVARLPFLPRSAIHTVAGSGGCWWGVPLPHHHHIGNNACLIHWFTTENDVFIVLYSCSPANQVRLACETKPMGDPHGMVSAFLGLETN